MCLTPQQKWKDGSDGSIGKKPSMSSESLIRLILQVFVNNRNHNRWHSFAPWVYIQSG